MAHLFSSVPLLDVKAFITVGKWFGVNGINAIKILLDFSAFACENTMLVEITKLLYVATVYTRLKAIKKKTLDFL